MMEKQRDLERRRRKKEESHPDISPDILEIAPGGMHIREKLLGLCAAHAAARNGDGVQHAIHIFRHVFRIAAYIHGAALLNERPHALSIGRLGENTI